MGAQAHFATQSAKPLEIVRDWYVIDAEDLVLGRLCTRVASILKGKHRPFVTPHVDCGDHVIVVNCEKVKLTGRKAEQKTYYRHSGYTGSIKSITAGKLLASSHADRVIRRVQSAGSGSRRWFLPESTGLRCRAGSGRGANY